MFGHIGMAAEQNKRFAEDTFTEAFVLCQQAERLEFNGALDAALEKYRESARMLQQTKEEFPKWESADSSVSGGTGGHGDQASNKGEAIVVDVVPQK